MLRILWLILFLLIPVNSESAIKIEDESTNQGYVVGIDFQGAGVSASRTGSEAIVTISGGTIQSSGLNIEVDGVSVSTGATTLDFDGTDFTLTESPTDDFDVTINDDGHLHTGDSISGIDISEDTNLTAGTNITLVGDTLNVDILTLGTHTDGNYVASITNGAGITGGDGGSEGAALTIAATLGTTIDISEETNLSAGTSITLVGDTLNVDDDFVLTAGDTMTGNMIVSGTMDITGDLQIPTGAGKTMEEAGELFHDTTGNDLVLYSGTSSVVFTPTYWKSFTIISPASSGNYMLFKAPFAITLTQFDGIVDPADSGDTVPIDIEECNSTGDSCTDSDAAPLSIDNDGATDSSITDPNIDAGDWVNANVGTITGTAGTVTFTFQFTKDVE